MSAEPRAEAADAATEAAARETVEAYFSAIHAGDTIWLGSIFSPQATLVGWDEGELKFVTRERWLAFVESIPSPRSEGAPRNGEILYVDVQGTTAMAKVREAYRAFDYVDFLSLVWTGRRWEIVHKTYHQHAPDRGSRGERETR
jgi:hypothetical protein